MEQDAEVKAMAELTGALSNLEPEAIERVLKWASDRFLKKEQQHVYNNVQAHQTTRTEAENHSGDDFPTLYDKANPQNNLERVLTAGYWLQVVNGEADFDSQTLNNELKNMGHPSLNITRDFNNLMSRKPRLAMQVRKAGATKQARKQYRLTTEGIRLVERLISGRNENMENE